MPDHNPVVDGSPSTTPSTTKHSTTKHSGRSAAVGATLVIAVLVLVALLIFVGQNSQTVQIRYLGANTSIGFGIALLLAAVAGVVFAALVGVVLKIRRSLRSGS